LDFWLGLRHPASMTTARETAKEPEDITRLFVERVNTGDVEGLVALYEPTAVMAYPPGSVTEGEAAIRALFQGMLEAQPQFPQEEPLPTLRCGDVALTSTRALDGTGGRAQVVRRQADGSWKRIIDRPETVPPSPA
jgi:ketosteroid isomerase-like protein